VRPQPETSTVGQSPKSAPEAAAGALLAISRGGRVGAGLVVHCRIGFRCKHVARSALCRMTVRQTITDEMRNTVECDTGKQTDHLHRHHQQP
jgi:hypothetical protein